MTAPQVSDKAKQLVKKIQEEKNWKWSCVNIGRICPYCAGPLERVEGGRYVWGYECQHWEFSELLCKDCKREAWTGEKLVAPPKQPRGFWSRLFG